ncbi:MAG: fasciclin domain-containing protein [Bacteroidota bacterium]
MKTLKRNLLVLGIMMVPFLFMSCDDDDSNDPQTIVDIAIENGNFSILVAALQEADLVDALSAEGPFTVFAPNDAAFTAAGISADNVDDIPDADLLAILQYHVVSGSISSSQLTDGPVNTLQGAAITIDATALTLTDLDGNVVNIVQPFDVEGSNGVIHTINAVLSPVEIEEEPEDIVTIAQATSSLSTLVDALTLFPDLVNTLSDDDGTFTVFAPNDDAFADLLAAVGQTDLEDVPESVIRNILEYHVISGTAALSTDLTDGQEIPALNMENVTVGVGDNVTINGNVVSTPNVAASNGVVHIIDGVLIPELEASIVNTIVEPAYFNVNFSTLTAAVVQAELLETLIDPDINWTLFAPDNAAFEAAGIMELPDNTEDGNATLAGILQYHVIGMAGGGELFASNLPSTEGAFAAAVTTLNGDFFLTNNSNGVFINGNSEVTLATEAEGALDYDNGVVHLINRTLQPEDQDIVAIATDAGFTELAAALTEAGLVTTLQGNGPFTVFAPDDAAFQALYDALGETVTGPGDVDDLLGEGTLSTVLLYHVFQGGRVFSSDLSDGLVVADTDEASFTVNVAMDGSVTLTDQEPDNADASVTATDILTSNGVIHVINSVILPVDLD